MAFTQYASLTQAIMSDSYNTYRCTHCPYCNFIEPDFDSVSYFSFVERIADTASRAYTTVASVTMWATPHITVIGRHLLTFYRVLQHLIAFLAFASAALTCGCVAYQIVHYFARKPELRCETWVHHCYGAAYIPGCVDDDGYFDCARECTVVPGRMYGFTYEDEEDDVDEMDYELQYGSDEEPWHDEEESTVGAGSSAVEDETVVRMPRDIGRTYGFTYKDSSNSKDEVLEIESRIELEAPKIGSDGPGKEPEERRESSNQKGDQKENGREKEKEQKHGDNQENPNDAQMKKTSKNEDNNEHEEDNKGESDVIIETSGDYEGEGKEEQKGAEPAEPIIEENRPTRRRISTKRTVRFREAQILTPPPSPRKSTSTPQSTNTRQEPLWSAAPVGPRVSRNLMEMLGDFYTPMMPAWHQYSQPLAAPIAPTCPSTYPIAPSVLQIGQGLPEAPEAPVLVPFPPTIAVPPPSPAPAAAADSSHLANPPQTLMPDPEKSSNTDSALPSVKEDFTAAYEAENPVPATNTAPRSDASDMEVDIRHVEGKTEAVFFASEGDNELARRLAAAGGAYKPTDMEAVRRELHGDPDDDSEGDEDSVEFIMGSDVDSAAEFMLSLAEGGDGSDDEDEEHAYDDYEMD